MKVVFVCSGNTCRSPFAEGYLNSLKLKNITATSRGLSMSGIPASENSVRIALKYGFDISEHLSTTFSTEDLDADFIITMSEQIRDFLIRNGADKDRTITLGKGIQDPFGGDIDVYGDALKQIADEIDKLVFSGFFDGISIVDMKDEHIPFIVKPNEKIFPVLGAKLR